MPIGHDVRRGPTGRVERNDPGGVDADRVGVRPDGSQTARRHQVAVGAAVAGGDEVVRPAGGVDELHQRHVHKRVETAQVSGLERLHEHRRVPAGQPVATQHRDKQPLDRQNLTEREDVPRL